MSWKNLGRRCLTVMGVAIATSMAATSVLADTYRGGGYTITIDGFAGSASYQGCDSSGNCLYIPQASHYTQGHYTWENGDYTYNMSPTGNTGQYRLKVFSPSGRVILNQMVNPVAEAQPQQVSPDFEIYCDVTDLQRGQLALRNSPGGEARAGLNNGNTIWALYRDVPDQGVYTYVEVITGPNSRVEGLRGWVNSNYLACYDNL